MKKELECWIQHNWKPKGVVDLGLGPKGVFTLIFSHLEDKGRIFEGRSYFLNNVGLYIRHWEACFNPHKEKFIEAPIWVILYSLRVDFWIPKILKGIGKALGFFFKVSKVTKKGKNISYARLGVYMKISQPLPDYIELEYH